MADVIALPTAAAEPIPRRRWHGPYPRDGVVSPISRQRYKRQHETALREEEDARSQQREVERRCEGASTLDNLALRVRTGEVVGVVLALEKSDGGRYALFTGTFEADTAAALEAAEQLCQTIDDRLFGG